MQTVTAGASRLTVTRPRLTPGSPAGTGARLTSRVPAQAVQPPCHLFRRGIEAGLLPYAAHHIGVLAHGPLARELLGGTNAEATAFGAGDLTLGQGDQAEIDRIMAAAVPVGGPSPEGMT